MAKKKAVKKTYKIWMVIEERTEFDDGSEKFKDLKDNTQSAGNYDTLEEAEEVLGKISELYSGDFTTK